MRERAQDAARGADVAAEVGVDVRTTLLAAHAVPPEYAGRADDYIDLVCSEMIPRGRARGLCRRRSTRSARSIGFTAGADAPRIRRRPARSACRSSSTPTSSPIPAAPRWPREFGALSADHLEYDERCRRRGDGARAGPSPCCCPAPSRAARNARAARSRSCGRTAFLIAVATDCNPGTSPVTSLVLMLNMACMLFR